MMNFELIFGIIIGLIILVILVVLHELGHAIVARRNGVVVEEFGIGFPPKAWGKKLKNGILLTLNWLPLGGFVKLQGEHDSALRKGDYGAATYWQKTKILFAGVAINWLTAILLLTGLALVGLPKIIPDQFSVAGDTVIVSSPIEVTGVLEGQPAAEAGIAKGDLIKEFAGQPVSTSQELIALSKDNAGQQVSVTYERDGQPNTVKVALRDADSAVFGASLAQQEKIKSTWSAPIVGAVTTVQFTWVTLQGLGDLVANFFGGLFGLLSVNPDARGAAVDKLNTAGASVAGPVGILGTIFPAASQAGFEQVVFLAAIISLTLAVMNALPIPALDGGRWFVTTLFKVLRKPLNKDLEEKIHGVGFLVLMALIVVITIADVTKLF